MRINSNRLLALAWVVCFTGFANGQEAKSKKDVSVITRIDDAKAFYKGFKKIFDFEDAELWSKVNKRYEKQGVTFFSYNDDPSVSVQPFRFNGGQGGTRCIAGKEPTYQGKMKVNFDVGVNKGKGVSKVGFNLAHVSKNGTLVEIYGKDDKLLGKLAVDKAVQGTGFIGFESAQPVMRLMIVPNVKIDEDFALDDLAFVTWKDK